MRVKTREKYHLTININRDEPEALSERTIEENVNVEVEVFTAPRVLV